MAKRPISLTDPDNLPTIRRPISKTTEFLAKQQKGRQQAGSTPSKSTSPGKRIPTSLIQTIQNNRRRAAELASCLQNTNHWLDKNEAEIMDLLEAGAVPEAGCPALAIVTVKGRRRVQWKDQFILVAGAARADRLISKAVAKETPHLAIDGKLRKSGNSTSEE